MSDHGDWPLRRLLTDVMGSGPKSADDMTYDQAREAAARILDGEPEPATLGAFLLAARWKVNTQTELAGVLDELRDRATVAEPSVSPVDCGANYDGKQETAILGVAAGLVAGAADVPVVVHAGRRMPATFGDTYRHALEALGVPTHIGPETSARMIDEVGFGWYFQPRFLPQLDAQLDRRAAIGVRTPLNTVETLVNPANASTHLGSFFHLSYGKRIAETLAESRTSSVDRVVLVQGMEGYDDLRTGRTTVAEWADADLEDWTLETADYGMDLDREAFAVDDVALDSAAITRSVLGGEHDGPLTDAVALNAAIRIYAGGAAGSVRDALETARDTMAAGDARAALADLQSFQAQG